MTSRTNEESSLFKNTTGTAHLPPTPTCGLSHQLVEPPAGTPATRIIITHSASSSFQCSCAFVLSCFSRVRLCVTPQAVAYQGPPSMGFSRQEPCSGVPVWLTFTPRWTHLKGPYRASCLQSSPSLSHGLMSQLLSLKTLCFGCLVFVLC